MTNRSWTQPLFAAALIAATATMARGATIDLPLDEYLCYQAKESKTPPQTKFKDLAFQVRTKDQFDIARDNAVTKFVSFCNPTTPTPAGGNSAVHLTEYAILGLLVWRAPCVREAIRSPPATLPSTAGSTSFHSWSACH